MLSNGRARDFHSEAPGSNPLLGWFENLKNAHATKLRHINWQLANNWKFVMNYQL